MRYPCTETLKPPPGPPAWTQGVLDTPTMVEFWNLQNLNPKPQTLNLEHESFDPQPQTLNPKHEIPDPQPSTPNEGVLDTPAMTERLLSECGTHTVVKARLWLWLEPFLW